MNAVSVTMPADANNSATAPMRRMFSSRSWAEKPRPNRLANSSPCRSLSSRGRGVQAVPHVVAVEHEAVQAHRMQLVIDQVRDRALAAGGQAGEPDHAAFVAVELLALFARYAVFVPVQMDFFVGHGAHRSSITRSHEVPAAADTVGA